MPGGRHVSREAHVRWLSGAPYASIAAFIAREAAAMGWPKGAVISEDAIADHFADHVDYNLAMARRVQEAWARRQPGEAVAESVASLPAAAHVMLQRVATFAMADAEINSVQEMVVAAKWGQEVLERAYKGLMAGQAELSPVRLLTELRAVIPQQHWPEFVRRLSAGKRGLPPPAVVERVEETPPGEPLGSPWPERPDPRLEAAERLAARERARRESRG